MNHTNNTLASTFNERGTPTVRSICCQKTMPLAPFSAVLYREAGIVTTHYMELLQRILSRTQVEQLFFSSYMKRRLTNSAALDRVALQRILRAAAQDYDGKQDWLQTLGDRINLAHPQQLLKYVLLPMRDWWEGDHGKEKQALQTLSTELAEQLLQLKVKRRFWMTQQTFDTEETFVRQETDRITSRLSLIEQQLSEVNEKIVHEQSNIEAAWPRWQDGLSSLLQQRTLAEFEPVPDELAQLWTQVVALEHQGNTCHQIKRWLLQRQLCLSHDEFYWQPYPRNMDSLETSWSKF